MIFDPNILTVEGFVELFPSDQKARYFFEWIRWGGIPKCPHCGYFKSYTNGCGKRYKCASCQKKYSVSVQSLLNYSKVTLHNWLLAVFIYQRSKGKILTIALAAILEVRDDTAFMMKNRLDAIFEPILWTEKKSAYEVFIQACNNFFILKDKWIPRIDFTKNANHIGGEIDISDYATYDRLVLYAKRRLFYCHYITVSFLSPEEVINESFIQLADYPEKRNDGEFVVKTINRTISRLWYAYQKSNPIRYKKLRNYQKEWKEEARKKLAIYYLAQLESRRLQKVGLESISTVELKADKNIAATIKQRVEKKRKNKATYE